MAVLESDIKALFKTITSETMKTVSAGQKTIISPTTVRNLAKEITEQAESGSIFKFEEALKKTESIIDKLGINLDDFNKGLSDRIKQLGEQKVKAEAEVQELRQSNIAAEVKTIKEGKEFRIETNILTRKEIKERTSLLNNQIKQTDKREKEIIKEREKLLKKDELTTADKEKIIADEKEISQRRAAIATESETLGIEGRTADTGGDRLEMPPMLAGFVDGLTAPFAAIGEAGMMLKDTITGIGKTFMFLGKGALKVVVKAFKMLALLLKPIPLAIGLAIGAVIFIVYKMKDAIGDFVESVKKIPGKIKNFFSEAFRMVKNFFIDSLNNIIELINKVNPFKNIELLERDEGPEALVNDSATKQKQEMQAIIKEAEEDQKLKEKILKDLEVPETEPFTIPNYGVNDRKDANLQMASGGSTGTTVINNVIGGSQQNVSSSSSNINTMSTSKNIDSTMINLESVPV